MTQRLTSVVVFLAQCMRSSSHELSGPGTKYPLHYPIIETVVTVSTISDGRSVLAHGLTAEPGSQRHADWCAWQDDAKAHRKHGGCTTTVCDRDQPRKCRKLIDGGEEIDRMEDLIGCEVDVIAKTPGGPYDGELGSRAGMVAWPRLMLSDLEKHKEEFVDNLRCRGRSPQARAP